MGDGGERADGPAAAGDRLQLHSCGRVQVRRADRQMPQAVRRRFLDVLAATANVQRAAKAAERNPVAFYKLRYRDERFAAAWREALESAMVRLEGEVLAHALGERGEEEIGDAERAGAAGRVDIAVAMELLKRRGALARGPGLTSGVKAQRRRLPIEEVEKALLARMAAMARQDRRK